MFVLIVVVLALLACGALAVFEARRTRRLEDRDRPATLEGGGSHLSGRR